MNHFLKIALATLLATLITACSGGGGGGSDTGSAAAATGSNSTNPVTPSTGSGTTTTPTTPTSPTTPAATAHTLQLSWTIPSTRENGTALTLSELSGYEIYYYAEGSSSGAGEVVPVSGGTSTSTKVTINGSGTYYFAIAARDNAGLLSNLSNYVAANLN